MFTHGQEEPRQEDKVLILWREGTHAEVISVRSRGGDLLMQGVGSGGSMDSPSPVAGGRQGTRAREQPGGWVGWGVALGTRSLDCFWFLSKIKSKVTGPE